MKVAIKIYEAESHGSNLVDVVVNNRYVIGFYGLPIDDILASLKEQGVTNWTISKLGDSDTFIHKMTNLVYHGDIEVTE